jgi:hypothetical protein
MSQTLEEKIVASAKHTIKACRACITTNHLTIKQQAAIAAMHDLEWLLSWYEYTKGDNDANAG